MDEPINSKLSNRYVEDGFPVPQEAKLLPYIPHPERCSKFQLPNS